MKVVFADSAYWIAMTHRQDQWHHQAVSTSMSLGDARLATTDVVLTEFATSFAGSAIRVRVADAVLQIMARPDIQVIPQSRQLFMKGLALYGERSDKKYSLQDCTSMVVMAENGIREVLTNDRHFEQEGYVILMKGQH